jgi:hypothetical protein
LGTTDVCATPACTDMLSLLRGFAPDGASGQPLLSARTWWIYHVADDGAILAKGAPVEGPFDSDVELPEERVVLIGPDGTILAEYNYDSEADVSDFGKPLADGRMLLAIRSYQGAPQLIVADPAAGNIEPISHESQTGEWPIYRVDALGRRVVIAFQNEYEGEGVSVVWGEVP